MTDMGAFEFNGEKYQRASKHQKEWGNKLIAGWNLVGTEAILDLGCGDGALTQRISELVPNGRVVGIDASTGMIATAEKRASDNLSFLRMDVNDMDFENEFDVIFSNAALHWIKNHPLLLCKSHRALKPGGAIRWNFAGEGNCANFFAVAKEVMRMPMFDEFFADFEWPWYMPDKSNYMDLIGNIGFCNYEVFEENADRYFLNSDEMIRWIDQPSIVPFLEYLPEDKRKSFRSTVIDFMIRRTKQADGRCFETFRRINVRATK